MAVLTAKEYEDKKNSAPIVKKELGPISIKGNEPSSVWYLVHPDKGFVKDTEIVICGEKLFIVDGFTKCETKDARNELLQQGYREILEGKQTRRK